MIATIVLPALLAAAVAFCTQIAPVVSAIGALASVASVSERIATDVAAAKHKQKRARRSSIRRPAARS